MSGNLEDDPRFVRHMDLTQLRAGMVVSEDDALALQELLDDYDKEVQSGADAYDRGFQHGRDEAAGKEIGDLLRKIDDLKSTLAIEKSMSRFWAAMASDTKEGR